jgi:hypothetical protein
VGPEEQNTKIVGESGNVKAGLAWFSSKKAKMRYCKNQK